MGVRAIRPPRAHAPAEAEGSVSGAHRASGGVPNGRSNHKAGGGGQTIPPKLRSVLRHTRLDLRADHAAVHIYLSMRLGSEFLNKYLSCLLNQSLPMSDIDGAHGTRVCRNFSRNLR